MFHFYCFSVFGSTLNPSVTLFCIYLVLRLFSLSFFSPHKLSSFLPVIYFHAITSLLTLLLFPLFLCLILLLLAPPLSFTLFLPLLHPLLPPPPLHSYTQPTATRVNKDRPKASLVPGSRWTKGVCLCLATRPVSGGLGRGTVLLLSDRRREVLKGRPADE